jgi:hypothetical protein
MVELGSDKFNVAYCRNPNDKPPKPPPISEFEYCNQSNKAIL